MCVYVCVYVCVCVCVCVCVLDVFGQLHMCQLYKFHNMDDMCYRCNEHRCSVTYM